MALHVKLDRNNPTPPPWQKPAREADSRLMDAAQSMLMIHKVDVRSRYTMQAIHMISPNGIRRVRANIRNGLRRKKQRSNPRSKLIPTIAGVRGVDESIAIEVDHESSSSSPERVRSSAFTEL